MPTITDWLMVIITFVYVVATIIICIFNYKSAKASKEAVDESKNQFKQSIKLQEQHNYDAVRPAVTVAFETIYKGETFEGSINIKNHGLGPAIIKELRFTKDDKEYKNHNGYITFTDLIYKRLTEEKIIIDSDGIFNEVYSKEFRNEQNDKDFLAVGEKHLLLGFKTKNENQSEIVESVFRGVHMELVYTDIYESKEWSDIKNLSYFKRK